MITGMSRMQYSDASISRGANKAFTLIEILIALAMFSFALIPIIAMYRGTTQSGVKSVNQLHAANLAVQRLEEFKFGGIIQPVNPESNVERVGEFKRLRELLVEESAPGSSTWDELNPNWAVIERTEDYETIPGFPNFKRYSRVSFYPLESPDPSKYTESILSREYEILTSRIQIQIKITWVENMRDINNKLKEREYVLWTFVTNKE
jgi:prepilin-type N-terminal cleavage/methylation domain-containing protein